MISIKSKTRDHCHEWSFVTDGFEGLPNPLSLANAQAFQLANTHPEIIYAVFVGDDIQEFHLIEYYRTKFGQGVITRKLETENFKL